MKQLKVLFTAVGSIGTRHLGNLAALCAEREIELTADVMRQTERALPEELAKLIRCQYRSFDEVTESYDAAFITNETARHFSSIQRLRGQCRHMFIEKPIFEDIHHSLDDIRPEKGSVYYVAAPIRFSNYFRLLQREVQAQPVYAARVIFSSYMPNWQKGRDYRRSFRTKASLGGGVDIDSLHEIDYITALFGVPQKVSRHAGHFSHLEMDACDIADYIFEYEDKLVQLQIDYFGRANNRRTELFCKDEVIVCDFNRKELLRQCAGTSEAFGPDDRFYPDEMAYFLDLISDPAHTVNINPIDKAFQTLALAKGTIQ